MREPVERLQKRLDYRFSHQHYIETALTHRSAGSNHNERMEFLGDAILGFIIADALYLRFPDAAEGKLSRFRAKLVKKESLATIAREISLGDYLTLGPGELRSGGHNRDSILADAFEAMLAAIYLDSDFHKAQQIILKLFEKPLNQLSENSSLKDSKTQLQEFLQAKRLALPVYTVEEVNGEQHSQVFTVSCLVEAMGYQTSGTGGSRKTAEQDAAQKLLSRLHGE